MLRDEFFSAQVLNRSVQHIGTALWLCVAQNICNFFTLKVHLENVSAKLLKL